MVGLCSSQLFTWGQTTVEVMKITVTSLKRSQACAARVHAPNPAAGHQRPKPLPETHRQVSCGVTAPFSWVLVHKVLLCPPRIYFSVLCKFWQLVVGLMTTSSKRNYSIHTLRAPVHVADHCRTAPPQQILKQVLSQTLWGPWLLVHTSFA